MVFSNQGVEATHQNTFGYPLIILWHCKILHKNTSYTILYIRAYRQTDIKIHRELLLYLVGSCYCIQLIDLSRNMALFQIFEQGVLFNTYEIRVFPALLQKYGPFQFF